MNKAQKQIELAKLADEQRQLNVLKAIYKKAAEDVNKNLKITNGKIEVLLSDLDNLDEGTRSVLQSQIYHKNFQEGISRQLNGFLNDLNSKQYKSIDEYLNACYETGFVGAAYELADQGIPLIMPLDQKKVVKAIKLNSKIKKELYTKLGEDVDVLKKRIANNISRGIAFSDSYENIARNIRNDTKISSNNAMRIARTEGHRVHIESSFDAMKEAQSKGADIVKQWNAQLDGKTRPHHRKLDGQIRELDEPFEIDGMEVMYPSAFGRPEEDINCRCVIHQRAKWALDEEELETLKERAALHGLEIEKQLGKEARESFEVVKASEFINYKKKYLKVIEELAEVVPSFVPVKTLAEAEEYAKQFVVEKTWSGDGNISYKGLSVESANKLNETLTDLFANNDIPLLYNIQPMNFRAKIWKGSENTPMAYRNMSSGELYFNPKIMKNAKTLEAYMQEGKKAYKICADNIDKFTGKDRELIETYLKAGRSLIAEDVEDTMKAIIEHEMGHHIQNNIIYKNKDMAKIVADGYEVYGVKISGYATKSYGEYIAESYAAYCNGKADLIDPELKKTFDSIKQKKTAESIAKAGKRNIIESQIEDIKVIPDAKLANYALDPLNEPNKAKAFEKALGYTQENYQDLKDQILELADESKFVEKGDSGYGMKYEYILEITGANGKKANVLTAWIQDGEEKRLTSVYVTKRKVTE